MASKGGCAVSFRNLHYASTDVGKGKPSRAGSYHSIISSKDFSHLCLLGAEASSETVVFFGVLVLFLLGLKPRYAKEASTAKMLT